MPIIDKLKDLNTRITCVCYLEVFEVSEYEAQTAVEKIMEKEHRLSDNIVLKIAEIQHTTTYGCGVNYNSVNKNDK
jgi:DNA-directed RNA polymerase subunit F